MKKLFNRRAAAMAVMLFLFLLAVSTTTSFAQTGDEAAPGEAAQGNQDANWVTALGLTPDQIARIRAIRQQNRLEWQAAKQRMHQAQRALDQAIYSDDASEAIIEQRAGEVAEAQAAEVRLRARTELGIRRVLTPQQLSTFRMIRERRIRQAQMNRRLGNANQQRPLGNRRLGDGMNPPPLRDPSEARPGGGGQGGQLSQPALNPRQRRGGLRRIRP
jgi:Spy/CpxP family protein refolding chaperone